LKRGRDPLRTRARPQRLGQEQPAHLNFDLWIVSGAIRDQRAQLGLDLGRVLFRDHAPIDAKGDLIRHHVRVDAALDQPDIERRRGDARRCGAYAREARAMRIERREDRVGGFEGVDPGRRHSRVRLPTRDRHLQMQTAVVCSDHRVGKAGGDRDVGPHQAFSEQPFRAEDSAGLLVIGEMQF
jgi:hypothetical protein